MSFAAHHVRIVPGQHMIACEDCAWRVNTEPFLDMTGAIPEDHHLTLQQRAEEHIATGSMEA